MVRNRRRWTSVLAAAVEVGARGAGEEREADGHLLRAGHQRVLTFVPMKPDLRLKIRLRHWSRPGALARVRVDSECWGRSSVISRGRARAEPGLDLVGDPADGPDRELSPPRKLIRSLQTPDR